MKNYQCFDIGGTYIKYGVINEKGEILEQRKFNTPICNCREEIPRELAGRINETRKRYEITAVGISTAGIVDSGEGRIIFCGDNISGYTGANLREDIFRETGLMSFVENDVNAAALGEMWMGAGKGRNDFVCITLGTGIGGAIIINGDLYKGFGGGAGEVGHMVIAHNGEECGCGGRGCYERYASTSALIRNYNLSTKDRVNSGEELMEKVRSGEDLALKAYGEFLNHIALGLANIVHFLDPGLVIIGGGISTLGQGFIDELRNRFDKYVMSSYGKHTVLCPASLGNEAGLMGACYGAKNLVNMK